MMDRRRFLRNIVVSGGLLWLYPSRLMAENPRKSVEPAYAAAERDGLLAKKIEEAFAIMESCSLCPRQCGVNRLKGEIGFCRSPLKPVVYSAQPHFGEEVPLVGRNGSGTIFFSNCNLRCIFCQNWPIAHEGRGRAVDEDQIASMMLSLQRRGCHNINVVTPTHVMPHILKATRIALEKGLSVPLVYNTGGYELLEPIRLLDGVVDIYLPDMKYAHGEQAAKYSTGARDYPVRAETAIEEMNRQVGTLEVDEDGIALRGVALRHLVMPNDVAGTRDVLKWVSENLPKSTYVNIMPQYRVEYKAYDYPEIARGITVQEFLEAIAWADEFGLTRLDERSEALHKFYIRQRGS